jgi:hypothetical protein
MRFEIALFGLLVLSSCAQQEQYRMQAQMQQEMQDAHKIFQSALAACQAQYPKGFRQGHQLDFARCVDPAERDLMNVNETPVDIQNLLIATHDNIASQEDQGTITLSQGDLEMDQTVAATDSEIRQQNAENAELRMQQQQVNDQRLQTTYGIINQLQQNNLRQQQLNYQNNMAVIQQPIQTYNPPSQSNCTSTVVGQYVQTHCY